MMALLFALLSSLPGASPQAAVRAADQAGVDLLFPAGERVARLRIIATVDEGSPELAWQAFLDKLFDYFDRDGDGFLSAAEAARVIPLPLPGGREAKLDFARLDSNGDGKGSRLEFREFYRAAGFTPVVVVVQQKLDRRLGSTLFQQLDRDGDGQLSRAELEKASGLMRRLDANEDEILTPAEILEVASSTTENLEKLAVKTAAVSSAADATLHLVLGKKNGLPRLDSRLQEIRIDERAGSLFAFRLPGGRVRVSTPGVDSGSFRAAKGFYLAQFTAALGNKTSLAKADLEADGGLQVLVSMFDAADRHGDGRLTMAELRSFLDLVELGVECQVVVVVEDRGRDLFDLLDANQDGLLDLAELNQAVKICEATAALPLTRASIPHQFRLNASRGTVGSSFGPVPLPTPAKPKAAAPGLSLKGPKWFQAMDRNGDGFLSPQEFLGPPELFRKLDLNGDGRISLEEAEAAGKALKVP